MKQKVNRRGNAGNVCIVAVMIVLNYMMALRRRV
jgi:hypothetical protein